MSFKKRMKEQRKSKGKTQPELATEVGVSLSTLRRWENEVTSPDKEALGKLAISLGTSTAYLLGETENPTPFTENSDITKPSSALKSKVGKKVIMVPVVSGIKACCGNGHMYPAEVEWEVIDTYPIVEDDVIGYTWQTMDFKVIEVEGDSMSPRINDGDQILFAAGIDVDSGDIVVVSHNSNLLVRGIYFSDTGQAILQAVNGSYRDKKVEDDEDFCVLGKVIGIVPKVQKIGKMW